MNELNLFSYCIAVHIRHGWNITVGIDVEFRLSVLSPLQVLLSQSCNDEGKCHREAAI